MGNDRPQLFDAAMLHITDLVKTLYMLIKFSNINFYLKETAKLCDRTRI